MVKLDKFDIVFDNAENAYFAGQEISGKVVIETSEPKKVNELLLELKGRANTYWTKHSGKSRKHCSLAEPYFCEQFNTYYTHQFTQSTSRNTKERILPKGCHVVPFSYTLPRTLPSSFEGDYGFIRYTCRAICERPWDFDLVSRRAFTVIGIEDINSHAETLQPVKVCECDSSISFWCCKQGLVTATFGVDRTGFTPGEIIQADIMINNESHRTLNSCVKLKQYVEYKAKTFAGTQEMKSVCKTVAKAELGEVSARSTFDRKSKIVVPPVPPRLSTCKIIQIGYALQLEIDGGVTTTISIQIGTIPYLSRILERRNGEKRETAEGGTSVVQVKVTNEQGETVDRDSEFDYISENDDLLGEKVESLLSKKKRVRMPSSILSELYPNLASPYYKESHFGAVDISEDNERVQYGERKFAPKYPIYPE